MNIVVKRALAGVALVMAYACANPVDIRGDVLPVDPSAFGDGGVLLGGAAGSAGVGGAAQGGTGAGIGGTSAGTGGTVNAGSGGAGMQAGLSGAGGAPIGAGGTVSDGTGGTAPAGGTAGVGGASGGGTGGGAGTGGTGTTGAFDPGACDFEDLAGCEDLSCEAACSTTDGGSCRTRCEALLTCVSTDPECAITEADPLCAARNGGTPNACTQEADSAGGAATTQETQPAFVARQLVECICTTPRP